jgi:hypothetical protein
MGNNTNCGCTENINEDSELLTENDYFIFSKRSKRNNKINLSLFSLLKDKMLQSNIGINSITKEYLHDLIDQNPKANSIIESYSSQLRSLYNSSTHENYLPPLQFINQNDNSIEYYEGEYNNKGEFNGIGIHLFDKNCIYIGQFQNDQYNGKGLLISNEGNSLFGDFVQGECKGNAHLIIDGQLDYEGQFENNQKKGFGIEKYVDGSVYEGNFVNGEKCGHGKYTFPNGEYYEGNFKDDLYEGEGVYEWPEEGRRYQGQFHLGNIEGNGTSQYSDGSVYKGHYVGGVKQGEGTYTWNNGQTFVGNWLNNELHGNGILTADGNKYEIIYRFGKIISSRNIQ